MPIEIFYTIVPLILVLGMFFFTARDQTEIEAKWDEPDVEITAIAKQWAWDFQYDGDEKDNSDAVVDHGHPGPSPTRTATSTSAAADAGAARRQEGDDQPSVP